MQWKDRKGKGGVEERRGRAKYEEMGGVKGKEVEDA
jgi:acyl-CoA-binding protein